MGRRWGPLRLRRATESVYALWPRFCAANTVIVDSKASRVECNLEVNIVLSIPFYVKWLGTLADDKEYLKLYLWPVLEALHACPDISSFRLEFPQVVNESVSQWVHRQCTGHAYEFMDLVEGEGTGIQIQCCNIRVPSPSIVQHF